LPKTKKIILKRKRRKRKAIAKRRKAGNNRKLHCNRIGKDILFLDIKLTSAYIWVLF
jgi:hypothetical protein